MIQFDFTSDYVLEDEVTLLRPLTMDDHHNLLPFAIHEPELWQYSMVPVVGDDGLTNYLDRAVGGRSDGKQYPFIVFDKRVDQYAGCTRYYDIQLVEQTLQLGYTWYGKQFQRTGLNRHCKYLLLQFAFEQMGMERVEFRADHNNQRSIEAMKAIGCQEEGILRKNGRCSDGTRRDSIVLSILREEWFSKVRTGLQNKIY
ncbi:GNAT family N-acetyltransferase [Parapedobacter tibetensis]|uniref:GNAT family N-acetyltransferase n=1 Tax=Parapedobacter tibetensis TaxID=2972951 RepID=UPI00214DCE67|nr:GNAT family protein [Parapedobacter tibetensis]